MNNIFEENSKLTEEEIKNRINESLFDKKRLNTEAMISEKLNKNKVMRVTKREENLLLFLRNNDLEKITKQLRDVFMYASHNIEASYLKSLISILSFNELLDIELLLKNEFITIEQITTILKALYENKNIIITGRVAVGKTTLMNIILNLIEKKDIVLINNRVNEFKITDNCKSSNNITMLSENISIEDISNPNYDRSIFFIDEICNRTNMLSLFTALNTGKQVFTTTIADFKETDIRKVLIDRISDNMKDYAKTTLNTHKFVIVNVVCNDGKRYVDKIEEI